MASVEAERKEKEQRHISLQGILIIHHMNPLIYSWVSAGNALSLTKVFIFCFCLDFFLDTHVLLLTIRQFRQVTIVLTIIRNPYSTPIWSIRQVFHLISFLQMLHVAF